MLADMYVHNICMRLPDTYYVNRMKYGNRDGVSKFHALYVVSNVLRVLKGNCAKFD